MRIPVFLQNNYSSRYSLLGRMSDELGEAFREAGCPVNPTGFDPGAPGAPPSLFLWFNFISGVADLSPALTRPGSRAALVQFFVDHPLALWPELIDALTRLDNFRMFLPCADGAHLLRLRWPRLRHAHCLHGVSREALAPAEGIAPSQIGSGEGARADGVAVMGSIHTEEEIAALRSKVPARLHRGCTEVVDLLVRHPWMTFEQAMDVVLGVERVYVGEWALLTTAWRYVTGAVNRARRISLVRALEGAPTVVYGAAAWKEFCRGGAGAPDRSTIEHRGDLEYAATSAALMRAKACLAWGPTQFTHSFSERILLSLAAGCATVADDRLLVRKEFACEGAANAPSRSRLASDAAEPIGARCVQVFDAAHPEAAREAVEALLADPEKRGAMGVAGREAVATGHLWAHRVETIAEISASAIAA